ncbi:MAG: UbiA family prenyltransferase [Myxococcales bacterium]
MSKCVLHSVWKPGAGRHGGRLLASSPPLGARIFGARIFLRISPDWRFNWTVPQTKSAVATLFPLLLTPVLAASCVISVQSYLGAGLQVLPVVMVGALALLIYGLNGLSDGPEDKHNKPERAAAEARYTSRVLAVAIVTLCTSAVLLGVKGRLHLAYGMVLLVGILYSFRLVPWVARGGVTWVRLKDVLLLKNITIGITWASSIFLLPLIDGRRINASLAVSRPFWFLMFGYGLSAGINSIFCDVEDRVGDEAAGVNTLPVRLGASTCITAIWWTSLTWTGLVAASYLGPNWIDLPHATLLAFLALGYPLLVSAAARVTSWGSAGRRYAIETSDALFSSGLIALSLYTS